MGAENIGLEVVVLSLFLPAVVSGYLGYLFELPLPSLKRENAYLRRWLGNVVEGFGTLSGCRC